MAFTHPHRHVLRQRWLDEPGGRGPRMRLAALVMALGFLLTGCAGGPDGDGAGAGGPDGDAGTGEDGGGPPEPIVDRFQFTRELGVGLPILGGLVPDDSRPVPFAVPEGYTRLDVTVEWTCKLQTGVDPLCDLELELRHGDLDLVTADYGSSPVGLSVDDPPAGRWTFWAFPSDQGSLQTGVEGTVTVSLS